MTEAEARAKARSERMTLRKGRLGEPEAEIGDVARVATLGFYEIGSVPNGIRTVLNNAGAAGFEPFLVRVVA